MNLEKGIDVSNLVRAEKMPKAVAAKPPRKESELRRAIRLLSRFLVGQRRQFVMALLLLIAEAWSATRIPLVLGFLIDYLTQRIAFLSNATAARSPLSPLQMFGLNSLVNPDFDTILVVTIGVVLLTLLNSATDSLAEIYLANGGRLLGYNLRVGLYSHLQKLSLAFFGKQRTGDLLTRVTGDISAIEEFVIKSLSDIVGSILLIGFILYTMIVGAWQVAIIAALIIPFMAFVSNYFSQHIKTASKKQRAREGELASAAQEMLTSIRVIQTYGSGGSEAKRFAEQSRKTMDTMLEAARLQALFSATVSTLESVAVALVIWLAVYLIFGSTGLGTGFSAVSLGFTIGTLTVFTKYIADMFKPTKKIIKEWNTFGKIYASVERIGDLMDRKPAVEDPPNALPAPRFQGNVAFNQVSFAYMPDSEDVKDGEAPQPKLALREVSFSIAPGEVAALVGGSGAGKSTIVQLLPRLYDPHTGAITIDGQDIRSFSLDSLRAQMSMVLQEAILFSGTVADNIAYGRPGATREEIIAAAMQANAHDFIEQMPSGYDTELSERAGNLSGGQRQRIAIARAFIRNTPILILDEPTTGLDADSSELVLLALRELMRGKATIIISHDLNLIRQADKIVAIKDGQIVQVGTHKELLKAGGLYADLYHKQFGHAVEEQGGQFKPAVTPAIEDDEEAAPVTHKVFQTMIGQALPQPVTHKVFQTMMTQALPPPTPVGKPPTAPAVIPAPVAAQAARPAPTVPPAAPDTASAAPQTMKPAPVAQPSKPAPATAPVAPAASIAPEQKPKPAVLETIVMRTIPALSELTNDHSAQVSEQGPTSATMAPSNDAQLDLTYSPIVQRQLPGLRIALDGAAMIEYLQAGLFGKHNSNYRILNCAPGKAIYMGDCCVLRYQLRIVNNTSGETIEPVVVGRVFQNQLASALYLRDKLAPLAALMHGRPEIAPFATPVAMIEPLNMVVHVFPIDGELPTLIGATDRQRMIEVLAETLPEALTGQLTIQDLRMVPVNYARRYRCVLRYEIAALGPGNKAQRRDIYGKIATDSQGAMIAAVIAALRERVLGNSGAYQFNIPRSLGFRPDLQLTLVEAIPGAPRINGLLKARLKGAEDDTPGALTIEEAIDACAQIVHVIHTSSIALGRRRTLDGELTALQKEIHTVQQVAPELGARFQAWLERIESYAEESDPLPLCFSHGDYTYTQLIFDGKQSGLVDFDTVCQAEPALDLGQFLAYLKVATHKAHKLASAAPSRLGEQLGERFLQTYVSATGNGLEDSGWLRVRASVYTVVSLLRMALHSWQQIKTARVENVMAVLEEEIACLPQLDY